MLYAFIASTIARDSQATVFTACTVDVPVASVLLAESAVRRVVAGNTQRIRAGGTGRLADLLLRPEDSQGLHLIGQVAMALVAQGLSFTVASHVRHPRSRQLDDRAMGEPVWEAMHRDLAQRCQGGLLQPVHGAGCDIGLRSADPLVAATLRERSLPPVARPLGESLLLQAAELVAVTEVSRQTVAGLAFDQRSTLMGYLVFLESILGPRIRRIETAAPQVRS